MDGETKRRKAVELRAAWSHFRGGRFEVGDSGGNVGMVMFHDREGRQWFVGSFRSRAGSTDEAERFVAGVNLVLEMIYEE